MSDKKTATAGATGATTVEWTVTGMDCASCATKIKNAVGRLPGVSDVNVAIMSERLKLTLAEGGALRAKRSKARCERLAMRSQPRKAGAKKDFVLPGEVPEDAQDEADGHDHGPKTASASVSSTAGVGSAKSASHDDSGHGSPGHVHDDPADRGKRLVSDRQGQAGHLHRTSAGCGLDHRVSGARDRQVGLHCCLPDRCCPGGAACLCGAADGSALHHRKPDDRRRHRCFVHRRG